MFWRVTIVLTVLVASTVASLPARHNAEAHAVLVHADPPPGAQLQEPPAEFRMWFSEPLVPAGSGTSVLDQDGKAVPGSSIVFDDDDRTHMSVELEHRLEPGIYTVAWETLSPVDGHSWRGSFSVIVLLPDGSVPEGTGFVVDDGDGGPGRDTVARWTALGGVMVFAGVVAFALMVIGPSLASRPEAENRAVAGIRGTRLAQVAIVAAAVAVLGGLAQLGFDLSGLGGLAYLREHLLETRPGIIWGIRQALLIAAVAVLIMAWMRRNAAPLHPGWATASLVFGLAGLVTFSLLSHAASVPGWVWAVAADLVHRSVAGIWLGGLLCFALLAGPAPGGEIPRSLMTRQLQRFSKVAFVSVLALALTGIFSALVQVPTWGDLSDTTYGRILLLKVGLVATIVTVAAINRRLLARERLAALRWLVAAEIVVGLAILGLAVALAQIPSPAAPSAPSSVEDEEVSLVQRSENVEFRLGVEPATAQVNRIEVRLDHTDGQPIDEVQAVVLIASHQELGAIQRELAQRDTGVYEVELFLGRPGDWSFNIDLRRTGVDDVRASFDVSIASAPPRPAATGPEPFTNPLPRFSIWVVSGGLVTLIGGFTVVGSLAGGIPAVRRRAGTAGGIALMAVGGIGVGIGVAPGSEPAARDEPPFTPAVLWLTESDEGRIISLAFEPFEVGRNRFRITVPGRNTGNDRRVELHGSDLATDAAPDITSTTHVSGPAYRGTVTLDRTGWWTFDVMIEGSDEARFFVRLDHPSDAPLSFAPPRDDASDPEAEALFREVVDWYESRSAIKWRQEFTSGIPEPSDARVFYLTEARVDAPDRWQWTTSKNGRLLREQLRVGSANCIREDPAEDWDCIQFPPAEPLSLRHLEGATAFQFGRVEPIDGQGATVLLFYNPRQQAWYAWWVAEGTRALLLEAMVAPGHFMVTRYFDADVPTDIPVPKEAEQAMEE